MGRIQVVVLLILSLTLGGCSVGVFDSSFEVPDYCRLEPGLECVDQGYGMDTYSAGFTYKPQIAILNNKGLDLIVSTIEFTDKDGKVKCAPLKADRVLANNEKEWFSMYCALGSRLEADKRYSFDIVLNYQYVGDDTLHSVQGEMSATVVTKEG